MESTEEIEAEIGRPRFVMMRGPTCAGKSRWVDQLLKRSPKDSWTVISADQVLRQFAHSRGFTVNEVATDDQLEDEYHRVMDQKIKDALAGGGNVVFDQASSNIESFENVLRVVRVSGHHYHTTLVDVAVTAKEQASQANNRNWFRWREFHMPPERAKRAFEQHAEHEAPSIGEASFDIVLRIQSPGIRKTAKHEIEAAGGTVTRDYEGPWARQTLEARRRISRLLSRDHGRSDELGK